MSTTEVKELRVNASENSKRIMYLAKEFLTNSDTLDVVSGTNGAPIAARAAESLVRLKYVTYDDIRTETSIADGRRRTRFVIRLRKTGDFKRLFDENEANRKKAIEEREKAQEQTTTAKPTTATTTSPKK
jgi:hypothetical protein